MRVEKRGYKLDCKPMNIVERTGFLCSTFQETAKARNLRLSFTAEKDNIRIDADESAMNKILNNLLHNALKYAESYIEVNVRSHDGTATVSITNDGEPISPEQRSEIFKPFVQYDKSPGPGVSASDSPSPVRSPKCTPGRSNSPTTPSAPRSY